MLFTLDRHFSWEHNNQSFQIEIARLAHYSILSNKILLGRIRVSKYGSDPNIECLYALLIDGDISVGTLRRGRNRGKLARENWIGVVRCKKVQVFS
jgi:hypothetical protein